jgi:methanogenic corrinoid protein MtbC1
MKSSLPPMPPSSKKPMTSLASLASRYLEAQLASNQRECVRLIDEALQQGALVQDLHLKVIQQCQREIGRLWEQHEISVAQEHLATAVSQLVIAHMYRHLPRGSANGKLVIVACVEGEQHDLGARMASDFLDMDGFDVRFLGANVPTESLLSIVIQKRPDLVALSVTLATNLDAFQEVTSVLRAKCGPSLPILAGGLAFTLAGEGSLKLPNDVVAAGSDASEMVKIARRLVGL